MGLSLPPNQFFKILIGCDDGAVFSNCPSQDRGITHSWIRIGNFDDVVPPFLQPTRHYPTGVDVDQEFHLRSNTIVNSFARDEVVRVQ